MAVDLLIIALNIEEQGYGVCSRQTHWNPIYPLFYNFVRNTHLLTSQESGNLPANCRK